jgi:hypothetical protein
MKNKNDVGKRHLVPTFFHGAFIKLTLVALTDKE